MRRIKKTFIASRERCKSSRFIGWGKNFQAKVGAPILGFFKMFFSRVSDWGKNFWAKVGAPILGLFKMFFSRVSDWGKNFWVKVGAPICERLVEVFVCCLLGSIILIIVMFFGLAVSNNDILWVTMMVISIIAQIIVSIITKLIDNAIASFSIAMIINLGIIIAGSDLDIIVAMAIVSTLASICTYAMSYVLKE